MKNKIRLFLSSFVLILIIFPFIACRKKPVEIGLTGPMSGVGIRHGLSVRNGAEIAVYDINQEGGLNGREIQLTVIDDESDPEKAPQIVRRFSEKKIPLVIGFCTSTAMDAAIDTVNQNQIVFLAPSVSGNQFTAIDDWFFRISAPNKPGVELIAEKIALKDKILNISVVINGDNYSYTENIYQYFTNDYCSYGGKIIEAVRFSSGETSKKELIENILKNNPEALFVLANGKDTGLILQQLRKLNVDIPVYTSGWAFNSLDLIHFGGRSAENTTGSQFFNINGEHSRYRQFRKKYFEKFGEDPNLLSALGYEAVYVAYEAMVVSGKTDPESLRGVLISNETFSGLQEPILIDQYGDAQREYYIYQVKNQKIVKVEH